MDETDLRFGCFRGLRREEQGKSMPGRALRRSCATRERIHGIPDPTLKRGANDRCASGAS